DVALVALLQACQFDGQLTAVGAEKLWAEHRARVAALPERLPVKIPEIPLTPSEEAVANQFLSEARRHGASNVVGVVKIRPDDLLIHQLHISTDIAKKYIDAMRDETSWAKACLGIGMLAGPVPAQQSGTKIVARLPHAEYRGSFGADGSFNIIESQQMIGVVRVGEALWLWSGYHRAYVALCPDSAGVGCQSKAILAAVVTHPKVLPILSAPRAPKFSDLGDEQSALRVRLWSVRYELQADLQSRTWRIARFRN